MVQTKNLTVIPGVSEIGLPAGVHAALMETTSDAVMVVNRDDRIVDCNQRAWQLLGLDEDELKSRLFTGLFPTSQQIRLEDVFGAVRATGRGQMSNIRLVTDSGTTLHVGIGITRIDDPVNPVMLVVLDDVSAIREADVERRRLETQIQYAQKLESLGVLAGGISHDLNNLLVGVLGNAGLALLELEESHPARVAVTHIEDAAIRASDLSKEVLAYSGKRKAVIEALDLADVTRGMEHLLQVSASKTASLLVDLAPEVPKIDGDAQQLQQVILNLVTNAAEAVGMQSGTITVSVGAQEVGRDYLAQTHFDDELPDGTYVYFEVADTGCGMNVETQRRIFDPFFTTRSTGRGLGLAAVAGIVRAHRGTLRLRSQPGVGTVVRVLFPSHDTALSEVGSVSGADLDAWRGSGLILVADDEESVRQVAQGMLERHGFEVITASDGQEAVELFRENSDRIAVVLLDATMQRLSGEAALLQMRRIRSDVRVVLSSGYTQREAVDRFAGLGWAAFIQKPYRMVELIEQLYNLLNR